MSNPNIIDLVATNGSASDISDAIKATLFVKAYNKIDELRPEIAQNMFFSPDDEEDGE